MANDLNRFEFIGRLGKDPDLKYLPDGKAVAKLSIAVSESWKDQQTGQKQERTTWVPVVAFGRLAEVMAEYLTKGSRVFVAGKFSVRKWQDQSGQNHYVTEVIAGDLQMLDSPGASGGNAGGHPAAHQGAQDQARTNAHSQARPGAHERQAPPADGFDDFSDDIPF